MGYMAGIWRGIRSKVDSTAHVGQSSDDSAGTTEVRKLIVVEQYIGVGNKKVKDNIVRQQNSELCEVHFFIANL